MFCILIGSPRYYSQEMCDRINILATEFKENIPLPAKMQNDATRTIIIQVINISRTLYFLSPNLFCEIAA
jgi:hypothetical protein